MPFNRIKEYFKAYLPETTAPLWKRGLIYAVTLLIAIFLIGLTLFTLLVGILSISLPDVRDFSKLAGAESTMIYDRNGKILYTFHGEENREYIPLSEISKSLREATIAIEDDQFYKHIGFDVPGIIKGALHEFLGIGERRGGSTITQQLAKNAFLTPKRSYSRKLRELILSIRIERAYDKDKILELYLNRIPYGNNAYGAELASQIYFGKKAKDLDLSEAALLASLPKAPTFYSPFGEYVYSKLEREFSEDIVKKREIETLDDLRQSEYTIGLMGKEYTLPGGAVIYLPGRVDYVLKRLADLSYISEEEKESVIKKTHELKFERRRISIRAPHFVFYVRKLLEEKYGKEAVEAGGMKVYTTIDGELQDFAEKIVADQAQINLKNYKTQNAALLAVDSKTGEILSMVGSADYFNDEIDGKVNMAFAYRQPGSSFKPFVYAKAFLNGYNPAAVLYDVETNFGSGYIPQNFDGKFEGPVNIRRALGQSRNIPAIKTYFLAGQEDEIIDFAEKMGISGLKERKPGLGYGPSLGIGSAEVRLADMVQGFSVLANTGMKKDLIPILKVEDRDGNILEEWKKEDIREIPVLDPQAAYLISNVLSDQSVNLGAILNIPGHTVAVKTGTSNKELPGGRVLPSNLWVFGYTPQITTGVWTGNSDGSALGANASGYVASSPIWNKFMKEYLKDKPNEQFIVPEGIKHAVVSKASGKLPSAVTPNEYKINEVFASFSVPQEIDDMFIEKEVSAFDGLLPNEFTPKEYIQKKLFMNHHDPIDTFGLWMSGIKRWAAAMREKQKQDPSVEFFDFPPAEITTHFTKEELAKAPAIQILLPAPFVVLGRGQHEVLVSYETPLGFKKIELYLDEHLQFVKEIPATAGKIRITNFTKSGPHVITARVYDKKGYIGNATIEIKVE